MNFISANPGQTVRIVVQTIDPVTGERADAYVPAVDSVFLPSLVEAAGYPAAMTRLDTGLYIYGLTIPTGLSSLGTYVISTNYQETGTNKMVWETFIIQVSRPFGNSSVVPL